MNKRNRQQPYSPYNNLRDAIFDKRQPTPEQEQVNELVVAHNSTAVALEEFQQRYEQLSVVEKQRVNNHLRGVYEILGLGPGQQLEEGNNYFQWLQYLTTNMNDLIPRVGRLEQLMENILRHLGDPPPPLQV